MTKQFRDSQQELKRLVREEEDKAAWDLVLKLRSLEHGNKIQHLVNLIQQAKTNHDLIPIIRKAIVRGNLLIELQEAEQRVRALSLRQRRSIPAIPGTKPAELKLSREELRKLLSKKYKMKNQDNGDTKFVTDTLLPYFKLKAVKLRYSSSKRRWPDIWVELKPVPVITVTDEWIRQNKDERRKRLVHEFLHLSGMSHGRVSGLVYSTYPEKDAYSTHIYNSICRNK